MIDMENPQDFKEQLENMRRKISAMKAKADEPDYKPGPDIRVLEDHIVDLKQIGGMSVFDRRKRNAEYMAERRAKDPFYGQPKDWVEKKKKELAQSGKVAEK